MRVLFRLAHVQQQRVAAGALFQRRDSTSGISGVAVSMAHGISAAPRLVASIAVMFSGRAGTPLGQRVDERGAVQARQGVVEPLEADGGAGPAAHPFAARPLEVAGEDRHPVGQPQQPGQALVLRRRVAAAEVGPPHVADQQANRRSGPSTAPGCAAD